MRICLLLMSLLFVTISKAQEEIVVPVFEHVETYDDIADYITIKFDVNKKLYVEDKATELKDIRQSCFEALEYKASNKDLALAFAIAELQFDERLLYKEIKPVMDSLRNMSLLKVHFVAHSKDYTRIPGIWTTGYLYKMNSSKESRPIIHEVLLELIKASTENLSADEAKNVTPPPPPPPPAGELSITDIKSGKIDALHHILKITDDGYIFNGSQMDASELQHTLQIELAKAPCAIIVEPSATCDLRQFIYPLGVVLDTLNELREAASLAKTGKAMNQLSYDVQKEIKNAYPFVYLIE